MDEENKEAVGQADAVEVVTNVAPTEQASTEGSQPVAPIADTTPQLPAPEEPKAPASPKEPKAPKTPKEPKAPKAPAASTPAPPPTGPVAVANTKLRILRTHPGYPHQPGEQVEMDPEQAKALANGGFVQLLTTDIPTAETR